MPLGGKDCMRDRNVCRIFHKPQCMCGEMIGRVHFTWSWTRERGLYLYHYRCYRTHTGTDQMRQPLARVWHMTSSISSHLWWLMISFLQYNAREVFTSQGAKRWVSWTSAIAFINRRASKIPMHKTPGGQKNKYKQIHTKLKTLPIFVSIHLIVSNICVQLIYLINLGN